MKEEKHAVYAQWATFVAVVFGLALVVYELRQSHRAADAAVFGATIDSLNQRLVAGVGEDPRSAIWKAAECPHLLTLDELVSLDSYYRMIVLSFSRERRIARALGVERPHDDAERNMGMRFFGTPPGRIWLEKYISTHNSSLRQWPDAIENMRWVLSQEDEQYSQGYFAHIAGLDSVDCDALGQEGG